MDKRKKRHNISSVDHLHSSEIQYIEYVRLGVIGLENVLFCSTWIQQHSDSVEGHIGKSSSDKSIINPSHMTTITGKHGRIWMYIFIAIDCVRFCDSPLSNLHLCKLSLPHSVLLKKYLYEFLCLDLVCLSGEEFMWSSLSEYVIINYYCMCLTMKRKEETKE